MVGCVGGCVGQWVGSGQITNYQTNLELNQDNSILFEDLCFVETPPAMGGVWAVGWMDGCVDAWLM